ncbi:MAG: cupin domain-containing protein [Pyrinomonadaceae bacterium]|nr:cupin domain-containing protein [Pyrinomonadaceae bacterium]
MTEAKKHHLVSKHSQVANWNEIPIETLANGAARQLFIGENLMMCRFVFPPNLETTAHEHHHEQMTMVKRGKVRFIIGEDEIIAEAGDVLRFPSHCWHGATMLDEEVELIDIFSPIREDFLTK